MSSENTLRPVKIQRISPTESQRVLAERNKSHVVQDASAAVPDFVGNKLKALKSLYFEGDARLKLSEIFPNL